MDSSKLTMLFAAWGGWMAANREREEALDDVRREVARADLEPGAEQTRGACGG